MANGPLHDSLQHREGAHDRATAGARALEVGCEALDDAGANLREPDVAEPRQDASSSRWNVRDGRAALARADAIHDRAAALGLAVGLTRRLS